MTSEEPILREPSPDHCYLKSGEFSNNTGANSFQAGVVTYDDYYESIHNTSTPTIKVRLEY